MLDIQTFDNLQGGSVLYKALAHPLASEALARLAVTLNRDGPTAIYDPEGITGPLLALIPHIDVEGIYVHDTLMVGHIRAGRTARPLAALRLARASTVLVASFAGGKLLPRISALVPGDANLLTLDQARLPAGMITNSARYLDALNFATNFAFFRDDDHFGTRLTSANYWSGYGAQRVKLFLRLYDRDGGILAQWEHQLRSKVSGLIIDSGEIRRHSSLHV